jgi:hypothetical protein
MNEAKQFARQEATFIVVGNKKDLEESRSIEMTDGAKYS